MRELLDRTDTNPATIEAVKKAEKGIHDHLDNLPQKVEVVQKVEVNVNDAGSSKDKPLHTEDPSITFPIAVIPAVTKVKQHSEDKLNLLRNNAVDANWIYNDILLKHFVSRRFVFYKSAKTTSLKAIVNEIESSKIARNVIIIGQAGVGKSTALKKLFYSVNAYKSGFSNLVYVSAKMVAFCKSLDELARYIDSVLKDKGRCLVFFDGLDELPFVKGRRGELEGFLRLFEEKSLINTLGVKHKFVISTRPEHFDFHGIIKKEGANKTLDTYVVFEVLPLNKKETLGVCKLVKRLKSLDIEKGFDHFTNKWPDTKPHQKALSEKEYLKRLSLYLNTVDDSESLLTSPLLCRYAYQIISDWDSSNASSPETKKLLSSRIESVINSYLKWEYHDENPNENTASKKGRQRLLGYQSRVFDFLTKIVALMGTGESLAKDAWVKARSGSRITANAAFCVLQEDRDGFLCFVHRSFRDYFLARHYISLMKQQPSEEQISAFIYLQRNNSAFSLMYAELLPQLGSDLEKDICNDILSAEDDHEHLSDYIAGRKSFFYTTNYAYTIEDYLTVFPAGSVRYVGLSFDRDVLNTLYVDKCLEIQDAAFLSSGDYKAISKNISLDSVFMRLKFASEIKIVTLSFKCVCGGEIISIGGYFQTSFNDRDLILIFRSMGLDDAVEDGILTVRQILESEELMNRIMIFKRFKDREAQEAEYKIINSWTKEIIDFLGNGDNYWCLFDGTTLDVRRISAEQNHIQMNDKFAKEMQHKDFDYMALIGAYIAHIREEDEMVQSLTFKGLDEIIPCFYSEDVINDPDDCCIDLYYSAHWKNYQLLKSDFSINYSGSAEGNISKMFSASEVLSLYTRAKDILTENPNEKTSLIMSDEELITLFLLGQGDKMVEIAEDTLELCDKYGHHKGRKLREFLIDDDTGFDLQAREVVRRFHYDNIWM